MNEFKLEARAMTRLWAFSDPKTNIPSKNPTAGIGIVARQTDGGKTFCIGETKVTLLQFAAAI